MGNKLERALNSKWYKFLVRFLNLLLLNILFCLTSVLSLLVLFFPGLVVVHTLCHKMQDNEDVFALRDYFLELKRQWPFCWRLEALGMGVLLAYGVLGYFYALYITHYQKDWFVYLPIIFLAVLFLVLLSLFFMLLMYNNYIEDDTFWMMIRKSALLARRKIGYTFLNILIFAAFFAALFFFPYPLPFVSFAFCAYIIEAINRRMLQKVLGEEKERSLRPENLFLPILREGNNMKKILIIGSTNMDYTVYVGEMPSDGETVEGISRFIQPGGKGSNQAIAAFRAGGDATFYSAIGKDQDGDAISSLYQRIGMKNFLKISENGTGNATIVVDRNSENRIIVIPGANGDIFPKDIPADLLNKADILLLQNEIPSETNEYLLKNYAKWEIVYNPAPTRPLKDSLFKCVSYFIVNETELAYYGEGESVEERALSLLKKGCKNVLVTLGKTGSVLYKSNGEILEASAFKVASIDTVAAGDTYLGYFVSSLAAGKEEKEAMRIASAASAIAVTRKGAVASIPSVCEVEAFLESK